MADNSNSFAEKEPMIGGSFSIGVLIIGKGLVRNQTDPASIDILIVERGDVMNTWNQYLDQEYRKMKKVCEKYGYRVYRQFSEIHICSRFESWYFEPEESGLIKLMHGNSIGSDPSGWHRQFIRRDMTYEDVARYIFEHEEAKYSPNFITYTFDKLGAFLKAASA